MANTFKFGNGNWATKEGSALAYNDENNNFKPLPFDFTRASDATRVNKDGLIEVVGSNEPRIDFLNDSKGALLLEPTRSNLIPYSEDFDNVAWGKANATTTISSELSPTGALNAYDVVFEIGGGYLLESITTTKTIGSSETISVFSKTDVSGTFLKYGGGTASGTDLEKKESFGNGWYRYSVTRTFTEAETAQTQIIISSEEVGLNVVLFGAQLEVGSYSTSYIPTQGSAVTRVADACNNAGNDQVFNDSEGVLFVEIASLANDGTERVISINDNSGNNVIRLGLSASSNEVSFIIRATTNIYTYSQALSDITTINKIAISYSSSEAKVFINGILSDSGALSSLPIGLSQLDFRYGNATRDFYGKTKQIKYFNTALTDQELIKLTS